MTRRKNISHDVLLMTAQGKMAKEIAEALNVKVKKVQDIKHKLLEQHGAANSCHLVYMAACKGLIETSRKTMTRKVIDILAMGLDEKETERMLKEVVNE